MEVQSVLFPKKRYSLKDAKKWIKKKGFKTTFHGKEVDETDEYFRFRQKTPDNKKRYFAKHIENGILYVMMY